jgi:hypothetical protein
MDASTPNEQHPLFPLHMQTFVFAGHDKIKQESGCIVGSPPEKVTPPPLGS